MSGFGKFGRSVRWQHFVGRRVDVMGRALEVRRDSDAESAIRHYLGNFTTATAKVLKEDAVVLVAPARLPDDVGWTPRSER